MFWMSSRFSHYKADYYTGTFMVRFENIFTFYNTMQMACNIIWITHNISQILQEKLDHFTSMKQHMKQMNSQGLSHFKFTNRYSPHKIEFKHLICGWEHNICSKKFILTTEIILLNLAANNWIHVLKEHDKQCLGIFSVICAIESVRVFSFSTAHVHQC